MPKNCKHCEQARMIVAEWSEKQGHDRCWYYPELFRKLADIFEVDLTCEPALPPREEFEEGCRRYQNEEYNIQRSSFD